MSKTIRILLILTIFGINISSFATTKDSTNFRFRPNQYPWADSIIKTMTLKEKIGQLIMIRVLSKENEKYNKQMIDLVSRFGLGGVCMFQGGPVRQLNLINRFQAASKIPVLFSIDGEWGLSMRLDSTVMFPRQIALGAIQDNRLIYKMGKEVARQFRRSGITLNFAPVADVNSNSKNPVINSRSFGSNRENVAQKSISYMLGMEDNGLMTCAKHFPGHGDTESDSHFSLPLINHTPSILDSIDIYPFKRLIESGISAVMVAHLFIPAMDSTQNQASSLSKKIVHDLLRTNLNFNGLIITDALDMQGVSKFYRAGEAELAALVADNDILLLPNDAETAIEFIKNAVDSCRISEEIITEKCLKVLRYKERYKVYPCYTIPTQNLIEELNTESAKSLVRDLTEASITVVTNKQNAIPLSMTDFNKTAMVAIGSNEPTKFQQILSIYGRFSSYQLSPTYDYRKSDSLLDVLSKFQTVVVSIHNTIQLPQRGYGVSMESVNFIDSLSKRTHVILSVFGNPYILEKFPSLTNYAAIVEAYQPTLMAEESAAQVIMGSINANGRISVSIGNTFPEGQGEITSSIGRIPLCEPDKLGLSEVYFKKIDSIVKKAIQLRIFPGCQIAIAYQGHLIVNKSYGTPTYIDKKPVENTDIYDIASMTKALSTTLAVMKLYENRQLALDDKISKHLPWLTNSNKSNITIAQLLTHNSGLKPFYPFWKSYIIKEKPDTTIFKKTPSTEYSFQVADSMFVPKSIKDSILLKIKDSPIDSLTPYQYSDFNFIILKEIVESITQCSISKFVDSVFYAPLQLSTIGYLPLQRFKKDQIMPTERDHLFRMQIVHGTVHDQTAALFGGISGHAGLFSNASDVAILTQILLNQGTYSGITYFKSSTIEKFTKYWFSNEINNRRSLGFDKPSRDGKISPAAPSVSESSFGHTGFTGTMVWCDPKYKLSYVFLSNRVYPDADNNRLAKLGIRTEIQELIYQAIFTSTNNISKY